MLSVPYVIAITVFSAAIVAFAQYIFKRHVPKFSFDKKGFLSLITSKMVIAGGAVYAIGLIFYLFALSSSQLSFVYPAFSSTFIFVLLISHFKLGEKISYVRLAGVLCIMLGIALVAFAL